MPIPNESALREKLGSLDHVGRVAFAAACCERLLPTYQAFAVVEGWGNPATLRQALDTLWDSVSGRQPQSDEIAALSSICMKAVPDSEDFQSIFTGIAQYSAASILHTLVYMLEDNLDELVQVVNLAVDSIDEYLNGMCDPYIGGHGASKAFDEWRAQSPMILAELTKQEEDLETIRSWSGTMSDLVKYLRDTSRSIGVQPFARGLVKERNSGKQQ